MGTPMTLRELATWEDQLATTIRRTAGTLEQRDAALARQGVYADYAACFGGYLQLLPDPESGLEAFKRALFLGWYGAVEPWPLTGLGGLPEEPIRRLALELDEHCRRDRLDDELRWMVPWYHYVAEHALTRNQDLPALARFVAAASPEAWRRAPVRREGFERRGQMGRYWLSLHGT